MLKVKFIFTAEPQSTQKLSPLLFAIHYDFKRLYFDRFRDIGFEVKNIFIKYPAEQDVNFTGTFDEYSILIKKYIALIVFDDRYGKQLAFTLAQRESITDAERAVSQLI